MKCSRILFLLSLLSCEIIFEVLKVECSPLNSPNKNKENNKITKTADIKRGKRKIVGTQIVGDTTSSLTKWPWQIAITTLQERKFKFRCGGTLVAPDVVLTAAHCLRDPDVTSDMVNIIAGDHDRSVNEGIEQTIEISEIKIHPGYTGTLSSLYSNDIALLKLVRPATLTDSVSLITISQDAIIDGTKSCLITGWGISDTKKSPNTLTTKLSKADVEVLSNDDCNRREHWDNLIKESQMCAYNKSISACLGDSGGPLVCYKNYTFIQYGVTSWGSKSCDRKPSVFTRVSYYNTWIVESMKKFKTT